MRHVRLDNVLLPKARQLQLMEEAEVLLAELLRQTDSAQRIAIRGPAGGLNENAVRLASRRAQSINRYLYNYWTTSRSKLGNLYSDRYMRKFD